MSDLVEPRKLKGFRDYTPEQAFLRKSIADRIWGTAIRAGFQPIITPALEYAETLVGSGGGDSDKEVYRFVDHGEREVALRFDLTVPFARFVAENHGTLVFPFKKVQIGDVWRGEKPQKGRYREFCQADLDIVGVDSLAADVEVIGCLTSALSHFAPMRFTFAIGHRILLSALIKATLGTAADGQEGRIMVLIDKLAKIGASGVEKGLMELPGMSPENAQSLLKALDRRTASGESDLSALEALIGAEAQATEELKRYRDTLAILKQLPRPNITFKGDLSLARGLGYYTGIVFEATVDDLAGFGSVSGGGRYNRLVSRFSTQELPGVGGSIGVDRFLAAIEEQTKLASSKSALQVYVIVATEDARSYAMLIAEELRNAEVICDIALKPGKVGNQFRQADRMGAKLAIVVGTDEMAARQFSLKVLATGQEQKAISRDQLVEFVNKHLS